MNLAASELSTPPIKKNKTKQTKQTWIPTDGWRTWRFHLGDVRASRRRHETVRGNAKTSAVLVFFCFFLFFFPHTSNARLRRRRLIGNGGGGCHRVKKKRTKKKRASASLTFRSRSSHSTQRWLDASDGSGSAKEEGLKDWRGQRKIKRKPPSASAPDGT